ncbi:MAG: phosphoheptose isomerase [bacterium]
MKENLKETFTASGKKGSPRLPANVKNLIIDIDGVVCEDIPNEEPDRMITAAEIPGTKEKINEWYNKGNIISFFTSRTEDLREVTENWLKEHGVKYHRVIFGKPRGGNYHYIDDREIKATKFEGRLENLI